MKFGSSKTIFLCQIMMLRQWITIISDYFVSYLKIYNFLFKFVYLKKDIKFFSKYATNEDIYTKNLKIMKFVSSKTIFLLSNHDRKSNFWLIRSIFLKIYKSINCFYLSLFISWKMQNVQQKMQQMKIFLPNIPIYLKIICQLSQIG